ncbi:hypothetical protein K227x_37440 [Rubripirellula lacrimiformis]|uniref:HAMP domain-containing protein n=2 Tax=Rubripirellula lacrimiformis TaxID=1930273 RepID=A0A517NDY8_9BACT|nr:hypothetical protein K227x_37440 [Rubripirellula lacrimiformis]
MTVGRGGGHPKFGPHGEILPLDSHLQSRVSHRSYGNCPANNHYPPNHYRSMYVRSKILVDPKVQWTIVGRLVAHWCMFLVCLIAICTMVRVMFTGGDVSMGTTVVESLKTQMPMAIVMLMLLPVFMRDSMKLSNRFAGPMFRLRTALRSVAQDQPTGPINFRAGDFWQEAAVDFNVMLQKLEDLKTENESLKSQIRESSDTANV